MAETVHIEVFLSNERGERLAYEIEDNDKNILFSPHILQECIEDFAKDREYLRVYPPDVLKNRLEDFKLKIHNLPSHITHKIQNLIKYIERNEAQLAGVKVVF